MSLKPANRVGVLALQGCVDPHLQMLSAIGVESIKVRSKQELALADRLIIPGGESSTMLKLMHSTSLFSELLKFGQSKPVWGICAGAILIAKLVRHPEQDSLGLIDIEAVRNFYGSQLDSFETELQISVLDSGIKVQFIRAPLLKALSKNVQVLAEIKDSNDQMQSVLLKQNHILASSFHAELGDSTELHRFFVEMK